MNTYNICIPNTIRFSCSTSSTKFSCSFLAVSFDKAQTTSYRNTHSLNGCDNTKNTNKLVRKMSSGNFPWIVRRSRPSIILMQKCQIVNDKQWLFNWSKSCFQFDNWIRLQCANDLHVNAAVYCVIRVFVASGYLQYNHDCHGCVWRVQLNQ